MKVGALSVAIKKKTKEDLGQLLELLDEKSRAILWHLWWYRHADISKLREFIDASSDFEALHRLKEIINEKAQKLWGKPIVSFEQSKIDPLTGDNVLFSWWFLDEENVSMSGGDKRLVDIFNEKDSVTVIAELPTSVDLASTDIQFKNGILKIKLKKESKNVENRLEGNNQKTVSSRVYRKRQATYPLRSSHRSSVL